MNNKTIAKEDLKEVLKKTMVEHKRLAKEKYNSAEDQVGGVLFPLASTFTICACRSRILYFSSAFLGERL